MGCTCNEALLMELFQDTFVKITKQTTLKRTPNNPYGYIIYIAKAIYN